MEPQNQAPRPIEATEFLKEHEKFISWARYLYWADLQRRNYINLDSNTDDLEHVDEGWRVFAVASLWLGATWVVVEGWRELKIEDEVIDGLLSDWPRHVELLRRYRNGVFHYQPKLLDERFHAYQKEGPSFVVWAFALNFEFQRFLWEYPERLLKTGTRDQVRELRGMMKQMIGWVPSEILPARKHSLKGLLETALARVDEAGDRTSDAARELLRAVEKVQAKLDELPDAPHLSALQKE